MVALLLAPGRGWSQGVEATPPPVGKSEAADGEALSLRQAFAEALNANPELGVARMGLESAEWSVVSAAGGFDPSLSVGVDRSSSRSPTNSAVDGATSVTTSSDGWSTSVSQAVPTGGTVAIGWQESRSTSDSANAVFATSVSGSAWLTVRQPLLDGLGPSVSLQAVRGARRDLRMAELRWRDSVEGLVVNVSEAYWGLLAAIQRAELARRSKDIAERELTDTLERQEEGFAGSGDVLQVERAVGSARQRVVVAEAEVSASQARLARLMGRRLVDMPRFQPVDVPELSDTGVDLSASLERALQANVYWLQARIATEDAEDALRMARNEALPDLDLSGSVGFSGLAANGVDARAEVLGGDNRAWALGADLSVDLPARAARASRSQARLSRDQALLGLRGAEEDLVLVVQDAVRQVTRDESRVALAEQTVDAARKALEADQELLREGRGSTRNVIISLESLDEAQAGLLQARIDLQASLLRLARVEGRLLGSVGIALESVSGPG